VCVTHSLIPSPRLEGSGAGWKARPFQREVLRAIEIQSPVCVCDAATPDRQASDQTAQGQQGGQVNKEVPMFALLQVIPFATADLDRDRCDDEYGICDAESVEVIKVDASEDRLKEYRAACEDFDELDPGGEWGPAVESLYSELVTKYRVTGILSKNTMFKIVRVGSGDDDDRAENEPAPLASGPKIDA
jgi:hypothetical protein